MVSALRPPVAVARTRNDPVGRFAVRNHGAADTRRPGRTDVARVDRALAHAGVSGRCIARRHRSRLGKTGLPAPSAAATRIRDEFGGVVPSDVEALESLPGIGSYTARAVAAFAFGQRVPVVDTNIRRVLARAVLGIAEPEPPRTRADMDLMESVLPADPAESVAVNAGVMELGAVFCTARTPNCGECPIAEHCAWALAGFPANAGRTRTPQAKYEGSVRQARGAILALARANTHITATDIAAAGPDPSKRDRALEGLLSDGLLVNAKRGYELPSA